MSESINAVLSFWVVYDYPETWCKIEQMEPVAVAHLKIIEASKLKPSDFNGILFQLSNNKLRIHI